MKFYNLGHKTFETDFSASWAVVLVLCNTRFPYVFGASSPKTLTRALPWTCRGAYNVPNYA